MLMYYFAGPINIEITSEQGHQMDKMILLAFITGVFVVGIVIAVIVALISKKAGSATVYIHFINLGVARYKVMRIL
jgi:hypothetical protein